MFSFSFSLLLVPATALVAPALESPQRISAPRVISQIEVIVRDVFEDASGKPDVFPYSLANRLHVDTRESVIRRELLFAVGEPVDEEALAQSERNLRSLAFLRDVEIVTRSVEDGEAVEVRVITSDSWTTVPELRLAKVGNEWVWAAGASERNLFGYGKYVEILRSSDLDRKETSFYYADPRLAGSRLQLTTLLSDASDGHNASLSIDRPFFSLDTLWGLRLAGENFDRLDPLYDEGERVEDLRHERRAAELGVSRALYRGDTAALRLHLAYRYSLDEVESHRREFGVARFGVSSIRHAFVQYRYLNRFERVEDINLGNQASAFFGVSSAALGGEPGNAYFFFFSERKGFALGTSGFLSGLLSWQARHRHGGLENVYSQARLDLVLKPSPRVVLLAKSDLRYGQDLDPEVQLRLGAESGLRGYPVRQFTGDRSLLNSVEGRWFFWDDVLRVLSLGVAAFVDSGYVWPEGATMRLADLHSDVGVSLLLGATRASLTHPGVRVDFAYALNPLVGQSRWVVSAGSRIGF